MPTVLTDSSMQDPNTLKLPHGVDLSNAFSCLYAHRPQSKKIIFRVEQEKNDPLYHI